MTMSPEGRNRSSQPERFSAIESIWDHAMLGSLFSVFLVTHPRRMLKVLKTEGVAGINSGYNRFFDNMRPVLYYLPPKK